MLHNHWWTTLATSLSILIDSFIYSYNSYKQSEVIKSAPILIHLIYSAAGLATPPTLAKQQFHLLNVKHFE
jgi:hypothetical protein